MLIQELKNLTDSRLVKRIDFSQIPPKVEYQLTPIGKKVMPLISEMRNFAINYENEIITNAE